MLKVIKSANKSVLEEAVNTEHTAVPMEGPDQPDQDDYGYTSTEANAFYQKYIEKVKDVKEEKHFAPSRPQTLTDLVGTKDRVRAALIRENEEKNNPTRSKASATVSTSSNSSNADICSSSSSAPKVRVSSKPIYDPETERIEEEKKKREEEQKRTKQRKIPPPTMDFHSLLKLAEKKQFEPILVPVDTKKEPQRLLTLKEKKELEERQKYFAEKEKRRIAIRSSAKSKTKTGTDDRRPHNQNVNGKNSNVSQSSSLPEKNSQPPSSSLKVSGPTFKKPQASSNNFSPRTLHPSDKMHSKTSSNASESLQKNTPSSLKNIGNKDKYEQNPTSSTAPSSKATSFTGAHKKKPNSSYNGTTKDFSPKDIKRENSDVMKARKFPPSDFGSHFGHKQADHRKQLPAQKRKK